MAYIKRSGTSGGSRGGKTFGGGFGAKKFGSRGGFGARDTRGGFGPRTSDRPMQLFKTTCAACNEQCEVPFRPNGSKPTYCRECFKKEGGPTRDKFEGGFGKPAFAEKRAYPVATGAGNGQIERRLEELSVKLDRIMIEIKAIKLNLD